MKIIYDAAHAFGEMRTAKNVSGGDISMFSFHAAKVFNTIEGALTFQDPGLREHIAAHRNFGMRKSKYPLYWK